MTALSLTYTLTNGTTADADKVMQDLNDIKTYINASVMRADGGVSATALLTLFGSNPTANNHAVRKAYLDGPYVYAKGSTSQSLTADVAAAVKFNSEERDTHSAYNLTSGVFTAPTTGFYLVSFTLAPPGSDTNLVRMNVLADGEQYNGPLWKPSAQGTGEDARQTFATVVRCTATNTITPRLSVSATASHAYGENLTIAWLHG